MRTAVERREAGSSTRVGGFEKRSPLAKTPLQKTGQAGISAQEGKDYRLHVHMVETSVRAGDRVAGVRPQNTQAVYIKLKEAMAQGHTFHRAITGVYLTRSTLPKELLSVTMD